MAFSKIPEKVTFDDRIPRGRLMRILVDVYLKTVLPAAWRTGSAVRLLTNDMLINYLTYSNLSR